MVFNADFALQVAHDRQAELRGPDGPRPDPEPRKTLRGRVGAWIVRLGKAVEGRAAARPNQAWMA